MTLLLALVAAAIAGHPVQVQCNVNADPGVYGYAQPATSTIHLAPEICDRLAEPQASRWAALGVLVLGHELGHLALPAGDEMDAECYGLAHVRRLARLLHWNPDSTYRGARYWSYCEVAA